MACFVISKSLSGNYKFTFASRKGYTVFTSIVCKEKSDCEQIITAIKESLELFTTTKVRNAGGKYLFRLSKDGLVLANSRKFSTELRLLKGIDEVTKHAPMAEILDFSENDFVFPDTAPTLEESSV